MLFKFFKRGARTSIFRPIFARHTLISSAALTLAFAYNYRNSVKESLMYNKIAYAEAY
jgi:hypothetical protein